jgi:hypothetical protein
VGVIFRLIYESFFSFSGGVGGFTHAVQGFFRLFGFLFGLAYDINGIMKVYTERGHSSACGTYVVGVIWEFKIEGYNKKNSSECGCAEICCWLSE